MFIDAQTITDQTIIESDLVILGGGPAGITLARELAQHNCQVCLVEAGGLQFEARSQSLYEGESAGIDYPLANSRLRFLGGSSNHWGGYCRPLSAIDFEQRDWVPYSGWPFGLDELLPYYQKASEVVEVAPARFEDSTYWQETSAEPLLDFASRRLTAQYIQYSPPTHFGERYQNDLAQQANLRVLYNANVVNIDANSAGNAITHVSVRTLTGRRLTVKSKQFVLAAGGLENARLLLLSDNIIPTGLGNQNDLVGRFFMEHPHLQGFCEIVIADLKRLPKIYYQRITAGSRTGSAAFIPTASFLHERHLLNATFQMGVAGKYLNNDPSSYTETNKAESHLRMLQAAHLFLANKDVKVPGLWMGVGGSCEQAPNPESRVSLSAQRDTLGLKKIRLDWRLSEQDRRSVVEHIRSLALEFGALGIGRMLMTIEDDGRWPEQVTGGNHHMGTTRMSNNPKSGVVDKDSKIHGIDNLYVAGSSVFPTSGTAHPTLTIVALALRLADHLKKRLT